MPAVQLLVNELKSRCDQGGKELDLGSEALCAAVAAGHLQVRVQWYHNPCVACALVLVSGHMTCAWQPRQLRFITRGGGGEGTTVTFFDPCNYYLP
jgi:hypothetical protein